MIDKCQSIRNGTAFEYDFNKPLDPIALLCQSKASYTLLAL